LKSEETFSQISTTSLLIIKHISILIDCKPTLPVLHIIITLFIDSTVYLYRVLPNVMHYPIFSLSPYPDPSIIFVVGFFNFLDVVPSFLAAPLFPNFFVLAPISHCPKPSRPISGPHCSDRLLRKLHDGASASPTFALRSSFGAIRVDFLMTTN
jgi:hypothetical protein